MRAPIRQAEQKELFNQMSTVVCFHKPDEINGYLSNWYLSAFVCSGVTYSSLEQYMMHQKALVFGDSETAEQIMQTSDAAVIKALGRAVKNYDDTVWSGLRQLIVFDGLLEKFRQNNDLRQQLLATSDSILAECAVGDRIWGIGLSMHDERRFDIRQWQGQNLLGFSLMQVRHKLS